MRVSDPDGCFMATNDLPDPDLAEDSRPTAFSFVTVGGHGLQPGVDPSLLTEMAYDWRE